MKELTYYDLLLIGVGYILGAGIYALLGLSAKYSGNMLWLSIFISGLTIYILAYSYMDMARNSENSESEYDTIKDNFGSDIALIVIWFAIISAIFACATISIGFGNYMQNLTGIPSFFGGLLVLLTVYYININGLRHTVNINLITTILEVIGLVIIIIGAYRKWDFVKLSQMPSGGFGSILYSSYLFIFAMIGFESLIRLSDDTIDSKTNMPLAIRDSIIITVILYILVGISAVSLLGHQKLGASLAPLADVSARIHPVLPSIISVIALGSSYNTALMALLTNSRLMLGLAKRDIIGIPSLNIKKTDENGTPTNALLFNTIMTIMVMLLIPNLESTTCISNLGTIMLLIAINMGYWNRKNRTNDINSFPIQLNKLVSP